MRKLISLALFSLFSFSSAWAGGGNGIVEGSVGGEFITNGRVGQGGLNLGGGAALKLQVPEATTEAYGAGAFVDASVGGVSVSNTTNGVPNSSTPYMVHLEMGAVAGPAFWQHGSRDSKLEWEGRYRALELTPQSMVIGIPIQEGIRINRRAPSSNSVYQGGHTSIVADPFSIRKDLINQTTGYRSGLRAADRERWDFAHDVSLIVEASLGLGLEYGHQGDQSLQVQTGVKPYWEAQAYAALQWKHLQVSVDGTVAANYVQTAAGSDKKDASGNDATLRTAVKYAW
ncbi:MAG: hypothetical protein ACXWPM_13280 [Bdellovibrionota bacterium]